MSSINHPFSGIDRTLPSRPRWPLLVAMLVVWRHRHSTRRHLRDLDLRQLEDVGLDPPARRREVAKWFWQP